MALNKEKFTAARGASGMTIAEITEAAGLKSTSTYMLREDAPSQFRLGEIASIYASMSDIAKPLFKEAVCDIFLD